MKEHEKGSPSPHNRGDSHQLFDKWKRRELKKAQRPISLYDNTYQREVKQITKYVFEAVERDETADDAIFRERLEEEVIRKREMRLEKIAGLTPEQQEHFELGDWMHELKARRTMSGKINFALSSLEPEKLAKLQQHDPEFIDPIIRGVQKRPARLEKAQRAMQRIYQPPPEDELRPGEQLAVLAEKLKILVAQKGVQYVNELLDSMPDEG